MENKERFKKFKDKIIHIIVDDVPETYDPNSDTEENKWVLESYQRDCIMCGLKEAKDNDIVIISDLDEIPNPRIVKKYDGEDIWIFEERNLYYYLNNLCINSPLMKHSTRIGRFCDLKNPKNTIVRGKEQFAKYSKKGLPSYFRYLEGKYIEDAGWHFSYLGDLEFILNKINSIVEGKELVKKCCLTKEKIDEALKNNKDIYGRNKQYQAIKIDRTYPKYIRKNLKKYDNLILKDNQIDYEMYKFKIKAKEALQNVFSVRNEYRPNKVHKVIRFFWLKLSFKIVK